EDRHQEVVELEADLVLGDVAHDAGARRGRGLRARRRRRDDRGGHPGDRGRDEGLADVHHCSPCCVTPGPLNVTELRLPQPTNGMTGPLSRALKTRYRRLAPWKSRGAVKSW